MYTKLYFAFICHLTFTLNLISQSQWVESDMPYYGRFDDISFVNDSVGFSGQRGFIFKTNNQGKNWTEVSQNPDMGYIRSVDFIDENLGFIGTLSSGSQKLGGIHRTTDGGKTFNKVYTSKDLQGVCGLAHFNNTVIGVGTFEGEPFIHIAIDTGKNFVSYQLDSLLSGAVDVHITSENEFWVAGRSAKNTGLKPIIIKSTDGGKTWKTVLYFNSRGSGYFWKIYFRENLIAAAPEIFTIENEPSDNRIFISKNGGTTWESRQVDNLNPNFGGVAILSDGRGWICDQHNALSFETANGGLTWDKSSNSILNSVNRIVTFENGNAVASGFTIYYLDKTSNIISEPKAINTASFKLEILPNPSSNGQVRIETKVEEPTFGSFEIFDIKGIRVFVSDAQIFTGDQFHEFNLNIPSGMYLIVWKNSHKISCHPWIVR